VAGLSEDPRRRADEHQAAVARARHLAQEAARGEERRRQVRAQGRLPAFERELPDRHVLLGPGAGDRRADVEPAQILTRLREEAVGLLLTRQVGPEDERLAELGPEGVRPLAAAMVVEGEPGPFRREGAGAGAADPSGGARDEHALARESRVHDVRSMFSLRRLGLARDLERAETLDAWVAAVRLAAVPFVFLEVAVERGNYPRGQERYAWALAVAFALGAALFLRLRARRLPALAFDWAVVSAWVALYSFEPGTPVRGLLVLPVVEAALRYGVRGGLLFPLATLPALAFFEWRQAVRLDLHAFDAGHIVGPAALSLLVGLAVGGLVERLRARGP
jgi:hypothetical protein